MRLGVGPLRIVYTPLHGAGMKPVRKVLARAGFADVHVVHAQEMPDGDFSTVKSPNPEEKSALTLGLQLASEIGADIVIGTDPDSDRIGVGVRQGNEYVLLPGNQLGALLADFLLEAHKAELTPATTVMKTVVTGELGAAIARARGCQVVETLMGFKYIGDKITEYEQDPDHDFFFGYEESYGCLAPTRRTRMPLARRCSSRRWPPAARSRARRSATACRSFTQSTDTTTTRRPRTSSRALRARRR